MPQIIWSLINDSLSCLKLHVAARILTSAINLSNVSPASCTLVNNLYLSTVSFFFGCVNGCTFMAALLLALL